MPGPEERGPEAPLNPPRLRREEFLARRAPELRRLAHQLAGDVARADAAVVEAASRLPRRATEEHFEQSAVRALVRTARPGGEAGGGALDSLSRQQRHAVVLAFGPGWDPESVARALRRRPTAVQRDVAAALRQGDEAAWRDLLADPAWGTGPGAPDPGTVAAAAAAVRARRRARRRRHALALGALASTLVAVGVAVLRIVTAPAPLPPTATAAGLLHWAPRGGLAREPRLLEAARRAWTARHAVAGRTYVLWAGRVGNGRLVVLQGRSRFGGLAVGVVGDRTGPDGRTRLSVIASSDGVPPRSSALAIAYDGNVGLPGLEPGEGAAIEHVLVAPGIDRVAERSITGATLTRPGFVDQPLHEGLSDAWLDVSAGGGIPSTAIRVYRHGGAAATGLLDGLTLQPVTTRLDPPPGTWAGLPTAAAPGVVDDDYVWWAQSCHRPDPGVRLLWSGSAPGFPQSVRLETVRCTPGRPDRAVFLSGTLSDTALLAWLPFRGPALTAVLMPGEEAPSSFVVVGSRSVRAIEVGGQRLRTRVAVGPLRELASVRVIR